MARPRGDVRRPLLRMGITGWTPSILALAALADGVARSPWMTLLVVAVVVTGLVVLFSTLRLVSSRVVRVGYWFLEPAPVTSLHFLPPKDLRDVRRRLGLFEARRALKEFLTTLDAHGIRVL